ncbi:gamma-glutamyltransferase [Pedobacter sp.]|uniref:gamma-glutamyltransferase n=1 Tax=Pedobacter sp. TaxID=1411316 RepID=UPI00396CCB5C
MQRTIIRKTQTTFTKVFLTIFIFSSGFYTLKAQSPQKAREFKKGAVVSAHPEATRIGVEILRKGGNAVDAAVAVQFALAVAYPNAGNIGGGGFAVYRSNKGEINSLDFREKAPAAAFKDMYLDERGNPIVDKSLYGHLASGVPGSVAGMVELHKKYGKLKWADLVEPAEKLAKDGFQITEQQAGEFNRHKERFQQHNPLGTALVKEDTWKKGDLLIQTELANTLKLIKEKGFKGFYEGPVADYITEEMRRGGGIITKADLKNYKAVWRKPVTGSYRGYKVITMPPTSSGGIALIQLLQSVEPYPLKRYGFLSDSTIQVVTEAERRVYADRAEHLGDPDFWKVPQKELLAPDYNVSRMANFSFNQATPSSAVKAGDFNVKEKDETTHFSIVDADGNAISITTTINGSYGSLVVVKGAGFLLNNEMDDFSVKPGSPNLFGLVGGAANAIAPHKRMLSSMTPSIVEKDGKLFMVVGTPGGSTIITSVFQTIVNVLDFGMDMQEAVNAKKTHHQWLPDRIDYEQGALNEEQIKRLEAKGYTFFKRAAIGRVDAILVKPDGTLQTGADPRGDDVAGGW